MKRSHLCAAMAIWCGLFFAVAPSMHAQQAPLRRHIGVPQDWSQRQIIFSRDALAQHPDVIDREPRVRNQMMQRWQVPNWGSLADLDPLAISSTPGGIQRDWTVPSLGARVRTNMFPAKFSFDPGAPPDCVKDYVVFGLAVAGVTGGQANFVAFNNLYPGLCTTGTVPNVLFAYNVSTGGGKILTSPVPSEDGTEIAFVESVVGSPSSAIFHVLTWHAGDGAIGTAAAPASMSSLIFSTSSLSSGSDSISSPWVDYGADTAYVGSDNGIVYQITSVFNGTPTLSGPPLWPVTLSSGYRLTAPVLDGRLGLLMVGSNDGNLYQIDTATSAPAALAVGATGSTGAGIIEPPIVDVTNGTTFVVSSNGGSSAVLVEASTSSMNALSTAHMGVGSSGGTNVHIYQPAFSNAYYNDPSTGIVTLCGTSHADTSPWQYEYGFTGRTMSDTPVSGFPVQLSSSTTDRCTGWTEFYNPNINSGVDFFFFGLTGDCALQGSATTTGCVVALSSDPTIPTASADVNGGPSGIVVDNYNGAGSNIYFGSVNLDTVYQFSQDGLAP